MAKKKTMTREELDAYIQKVDAWLSQLKQIASVMPEDSSNPLPPPPPPPR